jgi:hypothetical protein
MQLDGPLRCTYSEEASKKCKAVPQHTYVGAGESMYSSYSFTASALCGSEWSASRPGRALPPKKGSPVSTGKEAGWASEEVWKNTLASVGDRT